MTRTEPNAAAQVGAWAAPGSTHEGRPRRWIVVLVIAWAALLAAGVGWAVARGGPTAREQTTVGQAQPVVDRAVADIVAAAGTDGLAVLAISPFQLAGECSVTVLRPGVRYQRVVTAAVAPGTELALLERIAARLPAFYRASIRAGAVPRLSADAGFWVAVNGSVVPPGQVRIVADTGSCRVAGDIAAAGAAEGDRGPVQEVLSRLGVATAQWHTYRVACSAGSAITTVEAVGSPGSRRGPLDAALHGLGAPPVVSTPNLYAFRAGAVGVAARLDADRVVVTATTPCS